LVAISTEAVRTGFTDNNVLYRTLQRFPDQVRWQIVRAGEEQPLRLPDGRDSGLVVTAVPVPGKRPLHLEGITSASPEDSVAFRIREQATGRTLTYASAVGGPSAGVEAAVAGADVVFFDGTFWAADELPSAGLGTKRAEDMAHWPVGGSGGSLGFLAGLPARRKLLIHINNTNPLLRESSQERQQLAAAGVELAHDGLEGVL
jgi:pyrroloquinoline quinone biosynthesis protein B